MKRGRTQKDMAKAAGLNAMFCLESSAKGGSEQAKHLSYPGVISGTEADFRADRSGAVKSRRDGTGGPKEGGCDIDGLRRL